MSGRSRSHKVSRIVLSIVSALLIVAMAAALAVHRPIEWKADVVTASSSRTSHMVSPRQVETYCPARMTIADTDEYGDSEYQASNGDVASSSRYAAFGSVLRSSVSSMGSDGDSSVLSMQKGDSDDAVFMAAGNVDDGSRLQESRLSSAVDGTGSASSVMSWATKGDVKGVSAASCVTPELEQRFLVSGTKTGMTQQLVVANPSTKATSVDIKIWGAGKSGALALSTGATLVVGAGKETVMNLAAAASDQDALYVAVSSDDTPVAAVVRTVAMDGLTSKGSEYTVPNNTMSTTLAVAGLSAGDSASLYLFSKADAEITVSWTDGKGSKQAKQQSIEANRASVIDLGSVPKSATGLSIVADHPVSASAKITVSADGGQADFALFNAMEPLSVSAIAVPDKADATIGIVNVSSRQQTSTLTFYDDDGEPVGHRDIDVPAGASTVVKLSDVNKGNVAAVRLADSSSSMVCGMRVGQQDVSRAKLAGLSIVGAVDLREAREEVRANHDMTIVR